jgi:hypothetical protein
MLEKRNHWYNHWTAGRIGEPATWEINGLDLRSDSFNKVVFGLAFVVEVVVGYNLFMHKTQP